MAKITGKNGSVSVDGTAIGEITNFTVNETINLIDANSTDNPDWAETLEGRKSWTAEVTALFDADDAGQTALVLGTLAAFVFFPSGDTTGQTSRTGNARINTISASVPHDGMVEKTFSITGQGALGAQAVIA